jgi:hypothetical protein
MRAAREQETATRRAFTNPMILEGMIQLQANFPRPADEVERLCASPGSVDTDVAA